MKRLKELLAEKFYEPTYLPGSFVEQSQEVREHQNLHNDLHYVYAKYNEEHAHTIHEHTNESTPLNDALHHEHKTGELKYPFDDEDAPDHPPHEIALRKNRMDRLMKNVPKAPHDFHVYAGIHDHPFHGKRALPQKEGKRILPAFTSSSILAHVANGFAANDGTGTAHILKIHIPKGSQHGSYVATHSDVKDEHEFLLNRGTKLHIHPESEEHTNPGINGGAGTIKIWHAKIVE